MVDLNGSIEKFPKQVDFCEIVEEESFGWSQMNDIANAFNNCSIPIL